ncbi:uncharacterized protein LOC113500004 [Trichoplusia ni]|uniref:Uncharacterized protein LOC113500004 n=1 Tax=Trichoplusia ni TaxID=7111 RepID=A0A7E5W716_TRINI|nr:uncharacterized protein LOC113500004 [Trichoplusia ni]
MAGRGRINRMIDLVHRELEMVNDVDCLIEEPVPTCFLFTENQSPKPGSSKDNSPKPGCSTDYAPIYEYLKNVSPISSKVCSPMPGCSQNFSSRPNPDKDDNIIFTDSDEIYLICLDIVSLLVDKLPCPDFDYSGESSDDYIPNTPDTSDSDCSIRNRRAKGRRNVIIPQSGSDESNNTSFWDREGVIQGRKRKPRKSTKERREDRENRKKKRNLGKSYQTKNGKPVKERNMKSLETCRMKCAERIPEALRKKIFDRYWSLGDYDRRVLFISNLITLKEKKTQKMAPTIKNRNYSNEFFLKLDLECHRICKGCFLKTFDETPKFVQTVTDKLKLSGGLIINKSSRGKKPSVFKIDDERLEDVKAQILSFPLYESHYGRSKTNKKFLPPHLTIKDMYKAYCEMHENPVSITIYSWVFRAQNLSFKAPYVDMCVKCDTLGTKIKYSEGEEREENEKVLIEHQRRAETIYDQKSQDRALSITKKDTVVLSFDLQQCLPTPYLKSGAAFYKRPLWTFNLTLRDCTSNKVYCFMWHEGIGGRGANQVASCLFYYIMNCVPDDIKHLVFYSDSCSGQNKNIHVVCMFLLAMRNNTNLETITHNFLVPGHTHMDCDVDHALIEKAKKKTQMDIHHPRDWYQLVRTCSKKKPFTVVEMHSELFLDFASYLKGPLQQKKIDENKKKFKLSECAAFKYKKGEFAQFHYKMHGEDEWNAVNLQRKRGKSPLPSVFETECIPKSYDGPIAISNEKKQDLLSLLPLINPSVRSFYTNLLSDDNKDQHPLLNDDSEDDIF